MSGELIRPLRAQVEPAQPVQHASPARPLHAPRQEINPDTPAPVRPVQPIVRPAQPYPTATQLDALPEPLEAQLDLHDGPNTNLSNSRLIPITPATDALEVRSILRKGLNASNGAARYLVDYADSYNMTHAAIDARTQMQVGRGEHPMKIRQQTVSLNDTANFDIEWELILEPEKHLVNELGKPLAVLTDFLNKSKDRTRPARNASLPSALFCMLILNVLPIASAFFTSPLTVCGETINPCRSEPTQVTSTPRHTSYFTEAPKVDFPALFSSPAATGMTEVYAFVDIVLPAGSTSKTTTQALNSVDRRHWKFALDSEYEQLIDANTWTLVPKSDAKNVISGKWVFKIKLKEDGTMATIDRYKARWANSGFQHTTLAAKNARFLRFR